MDETQPPSDFADEEQQQQEEEQIENEHEEQDDDYDDEEDSLSLVSTNHNDHPLLEETDEHCDKLALRYLQSHIVGGAIRPEAPCIMTREFPQPCRRSLLGDVLFNVPFVDEVVKNRLFRRSIEMEYALVANRWVSVRLGFFDWTVYSLADVYVMSPRRSVDPTLVCVRSTTNQDLTRHHPEVPLVPFRKQFRFGVRLQSVGGFGNYPPIGNCIHDRHGALGYCWPGTVALRRGMVDTVYFRYTNEHPDPDTGLPKLPRRVYEKTAKFKALIVCLLLFKHAGRATCHLSGRTVCTYTPNSNFVSFPSEIKQKILQEAGFFKPITPTDPNNLTFDPWEEFPLSVSRLGVGAYY